jgi:hypothetical protein
MDDLFDAIDVVFLAITLCVASAITSGVFFTIGALLAEATVGNDGASLLEGGSIPIESRHFLNVA